MKIIYKLGMLLLLLVLNHGTASAQYYLPQNKVWVMGDSVGLDFNGPGDPIAIETHIDGDHDHTRSCASVADSSGQLLFYSNGVTVWTASGLVMPHGDTLEGGTNANSNIYMQDIIGQNCQIVPVPNDPGKYYFFTFKNLGTTVVQLYCNLVDMSLNNGQGDVDTSFTLKGIMLADSLAAKITAIRDCRNNVWVLVHDAYAPVFKAFKVSSSGINTNPVLSDLSGQMPPLMGLLGPITTPFYDCLGSMTASPDGLHIALCNWGVPAYNLSLYDFNPLTGLISSPVVLLSEPPVSIYGVLDAAFSPNGNQLYVVQGVGFNVIQYPLNSNGESSNPDTIGHTFMLTQMRLGPDGKIYFGGYHDYNFSTFYNSYYRSVGRINYPDNTGTACGFQDSIASIDFQSLSIPGKLLLGLPNEVVFPYSEDLGITITFNNDTLFAVPDNYDSYQWYHEDTLLTGENNTYLPINTGGWYSVKVTEKGGCTDSIAFNATKDMDTATGIGTLSQLKNDIRVYPNPASRLLLVKAPFTLRLSLCNIQGKVILQNAGSNRLNISSIANGMYFLRIEKSDGQLIKVVKINKLEN